MLMSHFHLNFSLELIALGLGALILVWSKMPEKPGMSFARLVGYIIIILTILNMVCTVTVAVKFWNSGYFYRLHTMMMQNPMMQQEMGMPCPMMQKEMFQRRMMMRESMMQHQATPQNPANQQETMPQNQAAPESQMTQGDKPMMQNPPSSAPNEMMQNQQPAQEAMPQNQMDQKGAGTENPTMTNQEENKT